jgi:hypothetical protein
MDRRVPSPELGSWHIEEESELRNSWKCLRYFKKKTNRENNTFSAGYAPSERIITIRPKALVG